MMNRMTLWDVLSQRSENEIQRWVKDVRLSIRDIGLLNQKLDRLTQLEFKLAIHTNLLNGPLPAERHIYKLKVRGDVPLRPLLCRGPFDLEREYTLLQGAREIGGRFDPADAPARAEKNRRAIIQDKNRRCLHERI